MNTEETEHVLTQHVKQSRWVPPADEPNATIDRYVPGNGPTLYRYTCSCGWEQQTWRTDPNRGLRLVHELHAASAPTKTEGTPNDHISANTRYL